MAASCASARAAPAIFTFGLLTVLFAAASFALMSVSFRTASVSSTSTFASATLPASSSIFALRSVRSGLASSVALIFSET